MILTPKENFELLVIELHLFLRNQAALGTLSHRIHETHAGQHHLLTAAFVTETPPASPTVMLQRNMNYSQICCHQENVSVCV